MSLHCNFRDKDSLKKNQALISVIARIVRGKYPNFGHLCTNEEKPNL